MNRREVIAVLASAAGMPLAYGCSDAHRRPDAGADHEARALALLDRIAENLLRLAPESATSLGIDTGERAALRSQLSDRSPQGQQRLASQVRDDLALVRAIDTAPLTHATRTSVEVVRSAYGSRPTASGCHTATSRSADGATRLTS